MYYLYIIKCQNGKLYTGITDNIERRLREHRRKGSHFTSYNPALDLLHTESFSDKYMAAKREKQIKGWTRAKKLALASGNLELLRKL